jgi:choline kinase
MLAEAYCPPLFCGGLDVGWRDRPLGPYELVGPKVKACALRPANPVSVARDARVRAGIGCGAPPLEIENRPSCLRTSDRSRTNTLYSLWVARSAVEGRPFLLLDGDLVFEPAILRTLLRNGDGNWIVCDRSRILDCDAVHVFGDRDGNIARIGKDADGSGQALGESIGLARIGGKASRRLFGVTRALLRRGARTQYYEAAFQRVIREGMYFATLDVGKSKWMEIDTRWDLHRARVYLNGSAKRAG